MDDDGLDFLGYKYNKAHFVEKALPYANLYIDKESLKRRLAALKNSGKSYDKTEQALNNWPTERSLD